MIKTSYFFLKDYLNYLANDNLHSDVEVKMVCLDTCIEYIRKYLNEKGIIIFPNIGVHGIKTITMNYLKEHYNKIFSIARSKN